MPEVCRPLLASNPQVLEDLLVSRDLNLVLSEDIWSNPVEFRGPRGSDDRTDDAVGRCRNSAVTTPMTDAEPAGGHTEALG